MKKTDSESGIKAFSDDLLTLLNELIRSEIPFVCYRKPGNLKISGFTINPEGIQVLNDYEQLDKSEGFVFHPFESTTGHPAYFLTSEIPFCYESGVTAGFIKKIEGVQIKNHLPGFNPRSKEEIKTTYTLGLNKILSAIKQGTIQKVVLSRLEFVPGFSLEHAPGILMNLFNQYHSAFVYLLHLPGLFTWMGATPEILLQKKEKSLRTIALAGTKESNCDGEIKWSDKEKHEQQLVSDYIEGVLADLNLHKYSKSPTYTVKAGQVFHLRTDFEIDNGDDAISFGKIASRLHPTPAVCGFPTGAASEIIKQVEKHDREYYCGFLGPVNLDGESSLYVNLRCLQFMDKGLVIYAGGGITEGSEVENEWSETVQKAETLLALLEKM